MVMKIKHLQPVSPFKIIFGIFLALVALYVFYSGSLLGLILLGAALKLLFIKGFELDLNFNRYRKIYWLAGISIGNWKQLPKIEYVSIFKTIKKSRLRVITAEANMGSEVYKLNLFYDSNKHIEAYITEESADAFKVAQHIASELGIDIMDATQMENKWLKSKL